MSFLYNYSREKLSQLYTNYDFLIYSLLPSPVENERKGFNMTNLDIWSNVYLIHYVCLPQECLYTATQLLLDFLTKENDLSKQKDIEI